MDNKIGWLLIPFGVFLFWVLNQDEAKPMANPSVGKEKYYLQFNKDEFFKGVISVEEHFRNIKVKGIDTEGFLNCNVKHLASAEGHADEAISHALVAEGENSSNKFRNLRNNVRSFRHDIQAGRVSPTEGINRVRKIRHEFESFNPEFDISKCEACTIKV